jgi:hypothetical protein
LGSSCIPISAAEPELLHALEVACQDGVVQCSTVCQCRQRCWRTRVSRVVVGHRVGGHHELVEKQLPVRPQHRHARQLKASGGDHHLTVESNQLVLGDAACVEEG